jgi:hypothetical protein
MKKVFISKVVGRAGRYSLLIREGDEITTFLTSINLKSLVIELNLLRLEDGIYGRTINQVIKSATKAGLYVSYFDFKG